MTVKEYAAKFTRLERFVPGVCTSEADRTNWIKRRLDFEIAHPIIADVFPSIATVINATTKSEHLCRATGKRRVDAAGDWADQRARKKQHSRSYDQGAQQIRTDGQYQQGGYRPS